MPRLDREADGFAAQPVALVVAVAVQQGDAYAAVEEGGEFGEGKAEEEVAGAVEALSVC